MTDQSQETSTSSNDTDNSSDLNIESQNEVRVEEGEALNENKGFKDFSDLAKNFKDFHEKNKEKPKDEFEKTINGRFGETDVEEVDFIEPDSAISKMHVTSAEHTRASRAAEILRERVEKTKTFIKDKKQKTTEVFNQKFDEETKEELKTLIEESKQIGKGFIGLIKKVIKK
jgi:hypothetical protein